MKLISRLKRAFQILFEPDDIPAGNTIYQLDPDNFNSFLPVRPIINAPFEKPRRFLIYEVGFDINCSEQESIQRFRDSLDELFSLLAHDIVRNICNCLGPEREIEHEVKFPITIKLDLDQSMWDFMLSGEAYDEGPWLRNCKASRGPHPTVARSRIQVHTNTFEKAMQAHIDAHKETRQKKEDEDGLDHTRN